MGGTLSGALGILAVYIASATCFLDNDDDDANKVNLPLGSDLHEMQVFDWCGGHLLVLVAITVFLTC